LEEDLDLDGVRYPAHSAKMFHRQPLWLPEELRQRDPVEERYTLKDSITLDNQPRGLDDEELRQAEQRLARVRDGRGYINYDIKS
jgi:hypothetical protein